MKYSSKELDSMVTREFLQKYYVDQKLNPNKVGKIIGCSGTFIKRKLKELNFYIRNRKEAQQNREKFTEETKQKMRKPRKFQNLKQHAENISKSNKGKPKNNKKDKHPLWREYGSKRITKRGEILIKIKERGWLSEHRYVMEQYLGRKLLPNEDIYHINNNLSDNKIENLRLGYVYKFKKFSQVIVVSTSYLKWKQLVLQRDNYTCQHCGSKENIEVHHCNKKFYTIIEEFLKNYPEFDPFKNPKQLLELTKTYAPFWDTNNGQTLCWSCHNLAENQLK
jgi:hypothetical protein